MKQVHAPARESARTAPPAGSPEPAEAVRSSSSQLAGRDDLELEIAHAIAKERSWDQPLVVAVISLDGPTPGDDQAVPSPEETLQSAARWLDSTVRIDGPIARLADDRLACVMPDLDCPTAQVQLEPPLARFGHRRPDGDGAQHLVRFRAAGLAQLEPGMTPADLLQRAEIAHDRACDGRYLIACMPTGAPESSSCYIETPAGEYRCSIHVRRTRSLLGIFDHAAQISVAAFRPPGAAEWDAVSLGAKTGREYRGIGEREARAKASRAFAKWARSRR